MQEFLGHYNVSEEEYNQVATDYAKKNGLTIAKNLGHGQWGVAFSTTNGEVIKVTADPAETFNSLKLVDKNIENVAEIYDVEVGERLSVIRQELLWDTGENEHIKNLYDKTLNKLRKADQCFVSLDFEILAEEGVVLSEAEERMAIDINRGIDNMYKHNANPEDIEVENIGYSKKGQYVIFDQRPAYEDPQEIILSLDAHIAKQDKNQVTNQQKRPKQKL